MRKIILKRLFLVFYKLISYKTLILAKNFFTTCIVAMFRLIFFELPRTIFRNSYVCRWLSPSAVFVLHSRLSHFCPLPPSSFPSTLYFAITFLLLLQDVCLSLKYYHFKQNILLFRWTFCKFYINIFAVLLFGIGQRCQV